LVGPRDVPWHSRWPGSCDLFGVKLSQNAAGPAGLPDAGVIKHSASSPPVSVSLLPLSRTAFSHTHTHTRAHTRTHAHTHTHTHTHTSVFLCVVSIFWLLQYEQLWQLHFKSVKGRCSGRRGADL